MAREFMLKWGGRSADGRHLSGFGMVRVGYCTLVIIPTARLTPIVDNVGGCLLVRWGPFLITWWRGK